MKKNKSNFEEGRAGFSITFGDKFNVLVFGFFTTLLLWNLISLLIGHLIGPVSVTAGVDVELFNEQAAVVGMASSLTMLIVFVLINILLNKARKQ